MVQDTNYAWTEPTEGGAEGQYVGEHNELVNDIKSVIRTIETAFDTHASTPDAHHDPIVPGDGLVEDADGRVSVDEDVLAGGVTAGDGLSDDNGTFNVAPGEVGAEEFDTSNAGVKQVLGKQGWVNPPSGSGVTGVLGGTSNPIVITPVTGPGFNFTQLTQSPNDVEGVAFHDGFLYHGEDVSGQATIHKFDLSGNEVDAWQLPSGNGINHTNTLEFLGDELFLGEAGPTDGFFLDYENETIIENISFNGVVDGMQFRTFIPDRNGRTKALFSQFAFVPYDSVVEGALVDVPGMRADGETQGNVDETFNMGFYGRLQAAVWRNGYLYAAKHLSVSKIRVPNADHIGKDFNFQAGLEWLYPADTSLSYDLRLEDIAIDTDTGNWYIGYGGKGTFPDGSHGIWQSREISGRRRLAEWGNFETTYSSIHNNMALSLRGPSSADRADVWFCQIPQSGIVEMWFYDNAEDPFGGGSVYLEVGSDHREQAIDNQGLGVNEGEPNYIANNNDSSATDTGIARPDSQQWVKFRLLLLNGIAKWQVSKDYGATWESGPEMTGGCRKFRVLRISDFRDGGGHPEFRSGPWTVYLAGRPEVA